MHEGTLPPHLAKAVRDRAAPGRKDQDFYADAAVYDILHAPGTAAELDGVEELACRTCPTPLPRQVWLEPACGSGRLTRLASLRGRTAIGFDLAPGMVAYAAERARKAGLRARFFEADMTAFAEPLGRRVDVAFNIINTIRHLDSDEAMLAHLSQMAQALRPKGVYIVGISLSAYGMEVPSEDVWTGKRGRCRVTQVITFLPPSTPSEKRSRRERAISHLAVERPRGVEHIDSTYILRTYNLAQWHDVIARAGWHIAATGDDAGFPYEPTEPGYALFALKPG